MKNRRHKTRTQHHAFPYSSLEPRQLLAGDVSVSATGSGLLITGDAAANEIQIVGKADGSARVVATTGTTINGGAGPFEVGSGLRNVVLNLNAGDDNVSIHGLVLQGSLIVHGNAGSERLNFREINVRQFELFGGDGNDVMEFHNVFSQRQIRVFGQGGDDTISVTAMAAGRDISIDTGIGNDKLAIDNLGVRKGLNIDVADGNDQILVSGEMYAYRARFDLGSGNDNLGLLPRTSGATTTATFRRQLDINGGTGDDNVALDAGVNSSRTSNLDGQIGTDAVGVNGAILKNQKVERFENQALPNLNQALDTFYAGLSASNIDTAPFGREASAAASLNVANSTLAVTPAEAGIAVDSALTLSGDTSIVVSSAAVQVAANVAGEDVLVFTGTATITGTFDATSGRLALTGSSTLADYQSALRSVTYQLVDNLDATGAKKVDFSVVTDRGTLTGSRNILLTALSDQQKIENFVVANNLSTQQTASGLHYIIETQGTGIRPTIDDTIRVKYRGTLLDGTEFDANDNAVFPLSGVIVGWQEGFPFFAEGGVGQLIIPASLAYGSQTRPGIPANSILRFEIELLDVTVVN